MLISINGKGGYPRECIPEGSKVHKNQKIWCTSEGQMKCFPFKCFTVFCVFIKTSLFVQILDLDMDSQWHRK